MNIGFDYSTQILVWKKKKQEISLTMIHVAHLFINITTLNSIIKYKITQKYTFFINGTFTFER